MWTSARTPRSIAPRWAPRSFAAGRRSSISSRSATTSRSASTRSSWLRSGSPARAGLVAASWPRDRSASRTTSRSATGRCWAPRRVLPRIFPREKSGWVRRPFRWARPSASSPRRSICPTWPVVFAPRSAGSSGWRPASGSRRPRRAHREWSMTRPDSVHPTAVVDPKATLGPGVQIGAFSVVGPDVTLGADAEVGHHCVLEGRVEIGERAKVGHGSVLGGRPQDLKYRDGTPSGVRIGADTAIREYVTIHRATSAGGWTEIGKECLLMVTSHVAHDCRVGDGAIIINGAAISGHCEIGERATIGAFVGLVPFTRIGAYAYVGGLSRVNADVPPYVLVDGSPATAHGINIVGLRRAGIAPVRWPPFA